MYYSRFTPKGKPTPCGYQSHAPTGFSRGWWAPTNGRDEKRVRTLYHDGARVQAWKIPHGQASSLAHEALVEIIRNS